MVVLCSKLINGICVKNNNYIETELDFINSLFPNAVLFDSSKKVLRVPYINESKDNNNTFGNK